MKPTRAVFSRQLKLYCVLIKEPSQSIGLTCPVNATKACAQEVTQRLFTLQGAERYDKLKFPNFYWDHQLTQIPVKCDEVHPTCGNCVKHEFPCEYPSAFVSGQDRGSSLAKSPSKVTENSSNNSAVDSTSSVGLSPPYQESKDLEREFTPDERRMVELQLLHHFVSVVAYTFPHGDEREFLHMWSVDVIKAAFKHSFLLNAIFAISSLHIVCGVEGGHLFYSRDSDSTSVAHALEKPRLSMGRVDPAHAHRIYLNLAVTQQREATSDLGPENADEIFIAAVLLSFQAWKLLPNSTNTSQYQPPLHALKMAKSVRKISELTQPFALPDHMRQRVITLHHDPDMRDTEVVFNPGNGEPFLALLDWTTHPEPDFSPDVQNEYETVLSYVGGVYKALLEKRPPRAMFRWVMFFGFMVPDGFLRLVGMRRPRALAILAHHLAFAKVVDQHWFFRGVADLHVRGLASIMPPEWAWAMEWPLQMLDSGITAI